jgi:hypothetical protein
MLSLLTEEQVAKHLHVSAVALRRWRLEGRGTKFIKVSPLVRSARGIGGLAGISADRPAARRTERRAIGAAGT